MDIQAGMLFDTAFEKNCLAVGNPDITGEFSGIDSEGVECRFSVDMVTDAWEAGQNGHDVV